MCKSAALATPTAKREANKVQCPGPSGVRTPRARELPTSCTRALEVQEQKSTAEPKSNAVSAVSLSGSLSPACRPVSVRESSAVHRVFGLDTTESCKSSKHAVNSATHYSERAPI